MTTKHTPGPWVVTKAKHGVDMNHHIVALVAPDRDDRALVVHTPHGSDAQADANVRLIAAAPELLEALEAVVAEWDALYPFFPTEAKIEDAEFSGFQMARAAIAKARGAQ